MIKTQYINLNMKPSGVLPVLYCSQYDIGRPLGLIVYNESDPVDMDTYTVTIEATRTDGTAIMTAVTTDGNIGAFATTATMTNRADKYPAKLVLFDSQSRRVASLAFVMCVTPKTMDENAESIEEDRSLFQQYTETVQTLIAEVKEDLQAEEAARIAAIAAEAQLRKNADAALQSQIDNGATVKYHHLEASTDSSWIFVKLPRDKYALAFHNCSGSDADSPTTRISNPRDYLSEHLTADIVTNCNYGGLDYPGRLAGTSYTGTVFTRRLFCFDTDNQDIFISAVGAAISSIASKYDVAFAVDEILVQNGAAVTFTELERYEPRNVFGWDDEYFYILFGEGRGNQEKGLTLTQCQTIMLDAGAQNAVNWDGGGSVCLAANIGGTAQKVNQYRDYAIEYPGLRKIGLCAVYTRKEA